MELGNNYDDIILTPEETELALWAARKEKHFRIERANYRLKLQQGQPGLILSAEGMFNAIQRKAEYLKIPFTVDSLIADIVYELCLYFTNSPGGKYDLNKGLMMWGPYGCRKTTLMRLFQENQKCSFRIVSAKVIADKVWAAGNEADEAMGEYCRLYSNTAMATEFKNGHEMGLCIDDMCREDVVNVYRNTRNVIADILMRAYDNQQMKGKVHCTLNGTRDNFQKHYGDVIVSRAKEMFNQIEFPIDSPDFRDQKKVSEWIEEKKNQKNNG